MSTANCRPTGAKPSPPGLPNIPTRPRPSPPGARRPRRSARATAASRKSRCRSGCKLEQVLRGDRSRSWKTIAAAAAIVAFVAGGGAGWFARDRQPTRTGMPGPSPPMRLEAYRLYVVEVRHPVEVPGSERAHMTQWLSKRLGYQQHIPDLSRIGLKLVGGRLLPGPSGAAAFYMYEGPSGERYTLYCSKVATPGDRAALYRRPSSPPPSTGSTTRSAMWCRPDRRDAAGDDHQADLRADRSDASASPSACCEARHPISSRGS